MLVDWMSDSRRLLGNFLGFYYTWMTPGDFNRIWDALQTPELNRNWPGLEEATRQDNLLHGGVPGERDGGVTVANMSAFKAEAASGKRAQYPGQKTVMTASATNVCVTLLALSSLLTSL